MFTTDDIVGRCSNEREFIRGSKLESSKKIQNFGRTQDDSVEAQIKGTSTYKVSLKGDLTGACDCGSWKNSGHRRWCKHLAALALRWLREQGKSTAPVARQLPVVARVKAMTEAECRDLLIEAAGRFQELHTRLTVGAWPE